MILAVHPAFPNHQTPFHPPKMPEPIPRPPRNELLYTATSLEDYADETGLLMPQQIRPFVCLPTPMGRQIRQSDQWSNHRGPDLMMPMWMSYQAEMLKIEFTRTPRAIGFVDSLAQAKATLTLNSGNRSFKLGLLEFFLNPRLFGFLVPTHTWNDRTTWRPQGLYFQRGTTLDLTINLHEPIYLTADGRKASPRLKGDETILRVVFHGAAIYYD